jgi:hypothetical protein
VGRSGAWTWTSFRDLRLREASRDLPSLLLMINSPLGPAAGGAGLDCKLSMFQRVPTTCGVHSLQVFLERKGDSDRLDSFLVSHEI